MALSATRKRLITVGLFAGAVVGSAGIASALTSSSTTTPSTPSANTVDADPASGTGTGVDTSNTDPTHEAGESAQHEADETAGKIGHGHGDHGKGDGDGDHGKGGDHHSNTDAAHEAGESPARAAEEATNDAKVGTATGATATDSTTP